MKLLIVFVVLVGVLTNVGAFFNSQLSHAKGDLSNRFGGRLFGLKKGEELVIDPVDRILASSSHKKKNNNPTSFYSTASRQSAAKSISIRDNRSGKTWSALGMGVMDDIKKAVGGGKDPLDALMKENDLLIKSYVDRSSLIYFFSLYFFHLIFKSKN